MKTEEIFELAKETYLKIDRVDFCKVKTVGDSIELCPTCKNMDLCQAVRLILLWYYKGEMEEEDEQRKL